MRQSYRTEPFSEKITGMGEKIVDLLVGSGATHKEANEALEAAQEMLSELKLVK